MKKRTFLTKSFILTPYNLLYTLYFILYTLYSVIHPFLLRLREGGLYNVIYTVYTGIPWNTEEFRNE